MAMASDSGGGAGHVVIGLDVPTKDDLAPIFSGRAALPEEDIALCLTRESSQEAARLLVQRSRNKNPIKACGGSAGREARSEPSKTAFILFKAWLFRTLPFLTWLPQYKREYFIKDLIAGITVGVMVIPQSMSYASIAGVPYVTGMYTAAVPPLIYTFFGTSKHLVVGPVALESLLIATGLSGILTQEECPAWYAKGGFASGKQQYQVCVSEYVELVVLLTAVVGILETLAYVFQLGVFLRFLGQPVAYGFTAGSAVLIMVSQLKDLLGIDIPNTETIQETIENLSHKISGTNGWPLLFGLIWLAYLFLHKFLTGRYRRLKVLAPMGPLICCFAGALLLGCWTDLNAVKKVKIIGKIPSGLPPASAAAWNASWSKIQRVLPTAVSAWIVGDMEAIAIGRGLAAKNGYTIDNTQEMLAQGVSNILGGLFSCYPATGSFSRSAVNNNTGAQTQLAAFISAVVMLLTLLFLTPIFYFVPKFALAAIVINSVLPLLDIPQAMRMYRLDKRDFFVWFVSAAAVLLLGILWGIVTGVAVSLLIILYESAVPQISVLWRLPGTTIYRNIKQESSGVFVPNVFVARIGCSIYFANASHVRSQLLAFMRDVEGVNRTEYMVVEMTSVVFIDYTGARALRDMVADFRSRGLQVAFSTVGNRLDRLLRRADFTDFVGEQWFFPTVHDAVRYCLQHRRLKAQADSTQPEKPLAVEDIEQSTPSDISFGNELGCSNDADASSTVVFVSLSNPMAPPLHLAFAESFALHGAHIVRGHVEPLPGGGSSHHYYLQRAGAGGKLDREELETLRASLAKALEASDALATKAQPAAPVVPDVSVEEVEAIEAYVQLTVQL